MTYTVAAACKALLTQATERAPQRSTASDGIVGDQAHWGREGYHRPTDSSGAFDPDGVVLAVDLTHDPANGCDAHALISELVARRDPRVHEAISMGQIWTTERAAEGWRPYGGPNPHDKHGHLSIAYLHRHDVSPYWIEEDDMPLSDEDIKKAAAAVYAMCHKDAVAILRGADQPSLKAAHAKLDRIMSKLGLT